MTPRCEQRLVGVHLDLSKVIRAAAVRYDHALLQKSFIVTEGRRTEARQAQLVAAGASRTMNSRHLTGHAVDLAVVVGKEVRWDWPLYKELADAVKSAAATLGVDITWGGDWKSFKDGPHFELSRKTYP